MRFDLNNLNPGTWFHFNDDQPDEGGVCLRLLSADDVAEINRQTVSERAEYHRGRRIAVPKKDTDKDRELTWDRCIVDWDIRDSDNQQIPCTRENKLKLMGQSPQFSGFVAGCLEELAAMDSKDQEAAEKN